MLIGKDGILKIGDYPVVSNWAEFLKELPCRTPGRVAFIDLFYTSYLFTVITSWCGLQVHQQFECQSLLKNDNNYGQLISLVCACRGVRGAKTES